MDTCYCGCGGLGGCDGQRTPAPASERDERDAKEHAKQFEGQGLTIIHRAMASFSAGRAGMVPASEVEHWKKEVQAAYQRGFKESAQAMPINIDEAVEAERKRIAIKLSNRTSFGDYPDADMLLEVFNPPKGGADE